MMTIRGVFFQGGTKTSYTLTELNAQNALN